MHNVVHENAKKKTCVEGKFVPKVHAVGGGESQSTNA